MPENPVQKFVENRNADPDEAKFFWSGGPLEVADRTWFQSMLSGTTAFDTDDGLVLVDTGAKMFAPAFAQQLRQLTSSPVHSAVYTHGHVDHAFGLAHFLLPDQQKPCVVAHPAALDRFERYARTAQHNRFINARQFGGAADAEGFELFEHPSVMPNELCEAHTTLRIGGLTFEVRHCRGETDDHLWVWCPERGVLCPGDLFIYAVPNAGNPQKAQRYPWDWAAGLREMAACQPRVLCPGHGGPVVDDPDKIQRMLTETADYLDDLVERTIEAMEAGSPPHVDIVRQVEPPPTDSPWLQPVYDEAEFIVRNVIRYFGGWWTGRPSELKPAPRSEVAAEVVALAGGVQAVVERARKLADQGDLRLACHLADYALEAEPDDDATREATAAIYEARAASERSLMAVNLFNSATAYARAGRSFR